jgi:Domain of unknown function (DUF4214)
MGKIPWRSWLQRRSTPRAHRRAPLQVEVLESRELLDAASAGFVAGLYRDFLHRMPTPAQLNAWTHALASGESRYQVAQQFTNSVGYDQKLITAGYTAILGRQPTSTESSNWVRRLRKGATQETLAAALLGSGEYYADQGSNNEAWLTSACQTLLGDHVSQNQMSRYAANLNRGSLRITVANQMMHNQAAYHLDVIAAFQMTMHANPSSALITYYTQQLSSGLTINGLLDTLAASSGYARKNAQRPALVDLNWTGGSLSAPTEADTETPITVTRTYTISGYQAAPGAFTINYYVSTNPVFGQGTVLSVGSETVSDSGDLTLGTHTATYPVVIDSAGTYYVFAQIQSGSSFRDFFANNNLTAAPQTIVVSNGGPQILLLPSVLATLEQEAASNTAQWQTFKTQLDSQLKQVIEGGYQASQLSLIASYALGYQILKDTDPATADAYADKAVGLMKSGLYDFQKGSWTARQFLARGDGKTVSFTLPNADLIPSSLEVFTAPVTTQAIVHTALNGQDEVSYYQTWLKVSKNPDGNPDYVQGVDWQRNSLYDNDVMDWSLGSSNQPAKGATYYVTESSEFAATQTTAFKLNGNTITFNVAPSANTGVFVEYVYGTHAPDESTLAYQQTGTHDGGFNSIYIDSSFTGRYLGKYMAVGYDWLYNYPGLTTTLKSQTADLLVEWYNYLQQYGYHSQDPADNYGAGDYGSDMFTALALGNGRDSRGPALIQAMVNFRQNNVVPLFQQPANGKGTLTGGFFDEGWSYGQAAAADLLVGSLAYYAAGLGPITEEQTWSAQVVQSLISEMPTQNTLYNGGTWYQFHGYIPYDYFFYALMGTDTDPTTLSYAQYLYQNAPAPGADRGFDYLLFYNPNTTGAFWSSFPLQYKADGPGLVTGRADWNYNSTWWSFQLGNLVGLSNHQTFAQGALQIQRGADDLLINVANYTQAHSVWVQSQNSNLVAINDNGDGYLYQPWEEGLWYGNPGVVMNNYEATGNYVYAGGDYHAAYSTQAHPGDGGPTTQLTRQVVYLRPDFIIVHDRAGTLKNSYPKELRWNFQNTATITTSGNSWTEALGSSKLFAKTFSQQALSTTLQTVSIPGDGGNKNVYRIATDNTNAATNVQYTTALETAPSSANSMVSTAQLVSTDGRMEGVEMQNYAVLFGTAGPLNPFTGSITYTITGNSAVNHLIVDLQPGQTYQIQANGVVVTTVKASNQGTISFVTTPSGSQTIQISLNGNAPGQLDAPAAGNMGSGGLAALSGQTPGAAMGQSQMTQGDSTGGVPGSNNGQDAAGAAHSSVATQSSGSLSTHKTQGSEADRDAIDALFNLESQPGTY